MVRTITLGALAGESGFIRYVSFWKQAKDGTVLRHKMYSNPSVHLVDLLIDAVIVGGFSIYPDRSGWTASRREEPAEIAGKRTDGPEWNRLG